MRISLSLSFDVERSQPASEEPPYVADGPTSIVEGYAGTRHDELRADSPRTQEQVFGEDEESARHPLGFARSNT